MNPPYYLFFGSKGFHRFLNLDRGPDSKLTHRTKVGVKFLRDYRLQPSIGGHHRGIRWIFFPTTVSRATLTVSREDNKQQTKRRRRMKQIIINRKLYSTSYVVPIVAIVVFYLINLSTIKIITTKVGNSATSGSHSANAFKGCTSERCDVQIEEGITALSDNNNPHRRPKIGSLKPSDVPKPKGLDLTNDNDNDIIIIENSTIQLGTQSHSFELTNINLP
jgi:hypothetical protein